MDTDGLRTFLAVHREKGFSNAARLLHRTQPAISRRIALLEEELGVPLFERDSGRGILSEAGRALLPHAERALAVLQDAENAVRALKTDRAGSVALAVVGTLAGAELGRALKRFARAHPAVDVRLRTARSAEVSDLVRRGESTIGLRYESDRSPDLEFERIGDERLIVVCPPSHRLAGKTVPSLAALKNERWLAFPEVPGQREIGAAHVFGIFLAHGLGEIDWMPVDSLTAQKRLVEAGFGLALLQESSVAEEVSSGTIAVVRVRGLTAAMPVFVVTRKNAFMSAAAGALHEHLRSSMEGLRTRPGGREDVEPGKFAAAVAAKKGWSRVRNSGARSAPIPVRKMRQRAPA